jgi:4-hydroxy-3-methylbut-2-enyl diphosphate reductase
LKVKVAKTAGFCMGVKRAMDIVLDATYDEKNKGTTVYTDGPLIHNPQVLDLLKEKGIKTIKEGAELDKSRVVIRAHGITPTRKAEIESMGARISDATCPHVMRVQNIIKRYAAQDYSTVILGDSGHAEVVGLLGYAEGRGHVVSSMEDVENLPPMKKVCVVAQTTQDKRLFQLLTKRLKEKYAECQVFETICGSTHERQDEVISLCRSVDAMLVVGGRGSANTARLVKICESEGVPTFHIETEADLDLRKLEDFEVVGVTAGASTPQWMLKRVVDLVASHEKQKAGRLKSWLKMAFHTFIGSCMYLGIGAVAMSYACAVLLGVDPQINYCAIAALFLFSMHVLNNAANKEAAALNDPFMARLYDRHHDIFLSLGLMGLVASFGVALVLDFYVFLMIFLSSVFFALAFRIHVLPDRVSRLLKHKSLEHFAGTKEIFFGIAWALTTALLPFIVNEPQPLAPMAIALAFTFSIAFFRAVLLDIRDIQGDRLVGKETIPIAIGRKWTKIMLVSVAAVMACLLGVSPLLDWTSNFSLLLIPCVLYACLYLLLYHRRVIGEGLVCEAVTDFNFILAGLLAFLWEKELLSPLLSLVLKHV